MNHCYRLIWSQVHNAWIAVTEIARSRGKGKSSTVRRHSSRTAATLSVALLATTALAAPPVPPPVNALPTGGVVTAGQAAISAAGNIMNINQASQRAAYSFNTFDIGAAATVNVNQNNSASVGLFHVNSASPSLIYGHLNATGHIFLLNSSGTYFAPGSQINVGGLVASTLHMDDNAFMAGNYTLSNPGGGIIEALGDITASSVALVGDTIHNSGKIIATTASLVSGNQVAIDISGNNLIRARITDPSLSASITNSGTIEAAAITLTTGQAKNALQSVVNNTGTIKANSLTQKGGDVYLEAATVSSSGLIEANGATGGGSIKLMGDMQNGKVNVDGTLKAEATQSGNGGFIETSAAHVKIAEGARVNTLAANGLNGSWLIDPQDFTIAATGGDISGTTLSSNLGGGSVTILSSTGANASGNGDIIINDAITWAANSLTLTAAHDIDINAVLTANGSSQLVMNTATTNGADSGVLGGAVRVGMSTSGFTGRVDFGARTGTGFLTINGNAYTVINSLGAAGSVTGTDLQGMNGNLAGHYALGSDIDATATSGWNAGAGFDPVGTQATNFTGNFEGLGHTVNNLTINRPATSYVGLFGYGSGSGSSIFNVGLVGGSLYGLQDVGPLIGSSNGNYIGNVFSTALATGTPGNGNTGGLIGYLGTLGGLSMRNMYATGNVSGGSSVGGLIGSTRSTVSNSYATGSVTGAASHVGGLIGASTGELRNSFATGNVTGLANNTGGLIGVLWNNQIYDSYATGNVTGLTNVGGLVGRNQQYGMVNNSFSTGQVSGTTAVGGLIGVSDQGSGRINGGFWDTQTSGQAISDGGTGLTTAQMKTATNFTGAGWSNTTWNISDGAYPTLKGVGYSCAYSACWVASGGGNWLTASNWYNNHIPNAGDSVFIDAASSLASIDLTGLSQNLSLTSLISNENLHFFSVGSTLTVTGPTTFGTGTTFDLDIGTAAFNGLTNFYNLSLSSASGTLAGSGTINVSNSFTQSGGIINRTGDINIVQAAGALAFNAANVGNVNLQASNGNVSIGSVASSGAVNVKAATDIVLNGGAALITNGGPVTLNSDSDASGDGGILLDTGSSINTNGGNIVLGGGLNPLTDNAMASVDTQNSGIHVLGDINAGSGNVTMHGQSATGSGIYFGDGTLTSNGIVNITGSTTVGYGGGWLNLTAGVKFSNTGIRLSTATGQVSITGTTTSNNFSQGVFIEGATLETTGSGSLTIDGTNIFSGPGAASWGVGINFGATVRSTALGGGSINLISHSGDWGTGLDNGSHLTSNGGAINLTDYSNNGIYMDTASSIDAGANGSITLALAHQLWMLNGSTLKSSKGSLAIASSVVGGSIGIDNTGDVQLHASDFANSFADGFDSIAIGDANTGDINVSSVTANDHLAFYSGNNINVSGAINADKVLLRADAAGLCVSGAINCGTVSFTGSGAINSLGKIDVYYNPIATHGGTPNYSGTSLVIPGTGGIRTAWMLVNDVDQLQAISTNLSGNYALGTNIDASATSNWNSGAGFNPLNPFSGKFDGLDQTISNLAINANQDNVGLFGHVDAAGKVSNVGLIGGSVNGSGSHTGSLVGENFGTINNAYATTNVNGNIDVGGLIGWNGGSISYSHASGNVYGSNYTVGGLIGYAHGNISSSYATGTVTGGNNVGGLIGWAGYGPSLNLKNSYATGNVSGNDYVGGLLGDLNIGSINNSYATGNVVGVSHVGGLLGGNNGTVTNSFWDTQTTGQLHGASNDFSFDANGKTTAEMKTAATFTNAGWGSEWILTDGNYPALSTKPVFICEGDNCWVGGVDNLWSTLGNWSAGHTPTGTETVYIDVATTSNILLDSGSYSFGSLFLSENLTVNAGASLNLSSLFTLVNGNALFNGTTTTFDFLQAGGSFGGNGAFTATHHFTQTGGTWSQIAANLPTFSAADFTLNGGTFIRAKGGDGSSATPYQIADVYGLQGIGSAGMQSSAYALANNIEASGTSDWNDGQGFNPIGQDYYSAFNGSLDGQHFSINNLTIDRSSQSNVGLFGVVGSNGSIQNIGITNASITGNLNVGALAGINYGSISNSFATGSVSGARNVGGLVGYNDYGTVSNDYASTDVDGSYSVGGLVGSNYYGTVSNSYATGEVLGTRDVGGLVGYNDYGTVSNSYATGDVLGKGNSVGGLVGNNYYGTVSTSHAIGDVSGAYGVGGLVGYNYSGSVNTSYATGNVTADGNAGGLIGTNYGFVETSYATGDVSGNGSNAGGLVGQNYASISRSYATGSVSGNNYVGGLVGGDYGSIRDSFAAGNVEGSNYVGGLVGGSAGSGTIDNSYSIGQVAGVTNVGGLIGLSNGSVNNSFWDTQTSGQSSSAAGNGLTRSQMKKVIIFTAASWDNTTIWELTKGAYPVLKGMPSPYPPGIDTTDDVVVATKSTVDDITNAITSQLNNTTTNGDNTNSNNNSEDDKNKQQAQNDLSGTTNIQVTLVSPDKIEQAVTLEVPKGKVLSCQ